MAAHVKETPKPPVELNPGLPPGIVEPNYLDGVGKGSQPATQTSEAFRNALSSVPVTPFPVVPQSAFGRSHCNFDGAACHSNLRPDLESSTVSSGAGFEKPGPPVPVATPAPMPPPAASSGRRRVCLAPGSHCACRARSGRLSFRAAVGRTRNHR